MAIQAINSLNTNQTARKNPQQNYFCTPTTMLPTGDRNFSLFNTNKVNFIVSQKEHSLPYLKDILSKSNDEKEIVETLYIVDKLAENKTRGIPAMYPTLARFNNSDSPNIQTFLAGIYRKTQVPDAFGPLVAMLIKNSIQMQKCNDAKMQNSSSVPVNVRKSTSIVDSNEEIGGAILEYIRNYSQGPKPIDYSA